MAVPAGTYETFSTIGIKEDLADIIFDISPEDTVFLSNIARNKATQTLHEWQTDSLATAATNSQVEGDDPSANTASPTTRLANYTNISWKVPRVTGTNRAVDAAGRADEFTYQVLKRGKELKRDIETTLLGLQAATAGAAGSARVCAGVAAFLWNNQIQQGASATTVTVTSGAPTTAPTAGTAVAFTETNLKDAIEDCWEDGGDPTVVLMRYSDKKLASVFGGIATQYKENSEGPATIIGSADVYISDAGRHQLVASRFMPAGNVYVLDMDYWKASFLRDIQEQPLSKTGDSDRSMVLAEYTLEACNPASSAKIYTTTST